MESIKVVLVCAHLCRGPEAVPLGAACVAAAIQAAFANSSIPVEAALVETFVEEAAGAGVNQAALLAENIKRVLPHGPAFIGFSLYSWNSTLMTQAARILREDLPEAFLFCGGPDAAGVPQGETFDVCVIGAAEEALISFLQEAFTAKGIQIAAAPLKDRVTEQCSPWLCGVLSAKGREGILWELARGCPFGCIYCGESAKAAASNKQVSFSLERLQAELRLFTKERVPYVFVLDPTFNVDAQRADTILDMIRTEPDRCYTHWHFEVRAELLTRSQAKSFSALGASLQIGLQAADTAVASRIGRNFDRKRFERGIRFLNEESVSFGLDLIYGLPDDTLSGYCKSLDYALSLYPDNMDLFRLQVIPQTILAERAAQWGLRFKQDAPYDVLETPCFSAQDLDAAEALSNAADVFYNQGRAVAWFNQVLYPLKTKPTAFLRDFAAWLKVHTAPGEPSAMQLTFLETCYRTKHLSALFSAVEDIVRFHGAWGRALAEGAETDLAFTYNPDLVCGPEGMDIAGFVEEYKPAPSRRRMVCTKQGPKLVQTR
ncbi:B12-binding domain-containing radical SAM protein [Breznakiellaceae bacterium SP9]